MTERSSIILNGVRYELGHPDELLQMLGRLERMPWHWRARIWLGVRRRGLIWGWRNACRRLRVWYVTRFMSRKGRV